jgi:large subunit ribosomal protein L25
MAEKETITVQAKLREGRGKNDARRARRDGMVPVSVYGGEGEPVAAVAALRDLAAILRSDSGHNTIFTIDVDGGGAHEVMFHERQLDPVTSKLVHADLRRLVVGQKIEVTVPIHLSGEPIGVREQDGHLEMVLREIEIRCDPRNIPDSFELDVTDLNVGDVLHISDVPVNEDIEILEPPDSVIATVTVLREEVVEAEVPVEGEEPAEPEVIAKGKKEDEDEG